MGFHSLCCTKARLKCADLCVISPPATDLMVWPMLTDDERSDVRAKELKSALAGSGVGGAGVERLEVKEVT